MNALAASSSRQRRFAVINYFDAFDVAAELECTEDE